MEAEDRTFLVAFPGYDVANVPAIREKGIKDAKKAKPKKHYVDQCLSE